MTFPLGEAVQLQDHVDAVGHHQRLDPAAQAAEREARPPATAVAADVATLRVERSSGI